MADGMTYRIVVGDCRTAIPAELLADSVVTDPPYHLTSIAQRFGKPGSAEPKGNAAFSRLSGGFMGERWDGGDLAFQPETWAIIRQHMKPGAHLIAFGGSRTFHRLVCAIEDAGFEIRDSLQWLYGTGWPKGRDMARDIDKIQGVQREILGWNTYVQGGGNSLELRRGPRKETKTAITKPTGDDAKKWDGWHTALRPAFEPIILARNPIRESSVAANVLAHGVGAMNIDATKIHVPGDDSRWPSNVLIDQEVADLLEARSEGSSRFFYVAKPDKEERSGRTHPTQKPVDLMSYLIRLVTPEGGTVLDPFMGSGTTGMAATAEGRWKFVGIELSEDYAAQARRVIAAFSPMFAKEWSPE